MQEFQLFGDKLAAQGADTGDVTPRPVETIDKASLDRIEAAAEDNRNCCRRRLSRERCRRIRYDDCNRMSDQFGREGW